MTLFLIVTWFGLFLQQNESHRPIAFEPRIVSGIRTQQSKYPYIAAIRSIETNSNGNLYMSEAWCCGSLIRKSYPAAILTAAHCVFNSSVPLIVELNTSSTQIQTPTLGVTAWRVMSYIVHEEFDHILLDNDIALLFIHADLTSRTDLYLTTVTIPNLENPSTECCSNGDILQIIGYGRTSLGAAYSNTLEYSNLVFQDRSSCNVQLCLWETRIRNCQYTYATNNNICGLGDSTSPCHGDSGGPLVKINSNIQVGIVSWGVLCLTTLPSIFTNTGVYYTWINRQLSEFVPTIIPTTTPTLKPTVDPTKYPSDNPTFLPSKYPALSPSKYPTNVPSKIATNMSSVAATNEPIHKFHSVNLTLNPTINPSYNPSTSPSYLPTNFPSVSPLNPTTSTVNPTSTARFIYKFPSSAPTHRPTPAPTPSPTRIPSIQTLGPTLQYYEPTVNPTLTPRIMFNFPTHATLPPTINFPTIQLNYTYINTTTATDLQTINAQTSMSVSDTTALPVQSISTLHVYDNTINNLIVLKDKKEIGAFLIISIIAFVSLFVVIMLLFHKYKCCIINISKSQKKKQNKISYNKVKTPTNVEHVEHDSVDGLEFAKTIPIINVDGTEHLNLDLIVEIESGVDTDSFTK